MFNFDNRPWGRWEEFLNESGYRVKRIIIDSGKRLSLQKHEQRDEHWVIVQGSGLFTLNGQSQLISKGDIAYIRKNDIHRVKNTGLEPLVIIEIQLGVCLEEDIIRLEDDWGRI